MTGLVGWLCHPYERGPRASGVAPHLSEGPFVKTTVRHMLPVLNARRLALLGLAAAGVVAGVAGPAAAASAAAPAAASAPSAPAAAPAAPAPAAPAPAAKSV